MRTLRRLLGAAALALGAAVPLSLAPTAAHAAASCGTHSVAVVVDFGALGGGAKQTCVSGGGKASSLFAAAGHTLSRVQSQPGAVCSVDGEPADPCPQMPPANRYWGLFWASGSSSHWTYASSGVDGLNVPAGGSVAFAWQSAAGTRSPSIAPAVTRTASSSSPSAKASTASKSTASKSKGTAEKSHATSTPVKKAAGTPSATASRTLSPDASPSAVPSSSTPTPSATASASDTAGTTIDLTASPSSSAAASTDPAATGSAQPATVSANSAESGSDGLPGWVAPAAVVVVLAAGGGVAVARRRARG